MKKLIALMLLCVAALACTACQGRPISSLQADVAPGTHEESGKSGADASRQTQSPVQSIAGSKIRLTFGEQQCVATLNDSPASGDFLSMLPLELTFEDYNATEKIAYLPRELTAQNASAGWTPRKGDIALYAPWGNLAIFYEDGVYGQGLFALGHIDADIDVLGAMDEDFAARIEALDEAELGTDGI